MFPHLLVAVIIVVVAVLLFFLYRLYASASALAAKVSDLAANLDHTKTLLVDSAEVELIVRQEISKPPRAPFPEKKQVSLTTPAGDPARSAAADNAAVAAATSGKAPAPAAIPRRLDEKPLGTRVVPVNKAPRVEAPRVEAQRVDPVDKAPRVDAPRVDPVDKAPRVDPVDRAPRVDPVDRAPRVNPTLPDAVISRQKENAEQVSAEAHDVTLDSVFGEDINKIFAIAQISGIEFNFDAMSRDDQEDPRTRSTISTMFMAAQAAETFFADRQGAGGDSNPGVVIQELKD